VGSCWAVVAQLRRIAKAGADGQILAVNTTDLDTGTSRVFDLVAEAQRAADSGQVDRIHNIMLASAGIPRAFPFRMIDEELYVDGGVTRNIIYGGRIGEETVYRPNGKSPTRTCRSLSFASGLFSTISSVRFRRWLHQTG
jgi:hypothetical protein